MPTTGFVLPASQSIDAGNGTWTLPGNVLADDGAEATFSLAVKNSTGRWLIAGTFGFDSAIPAGSTIDQVNIRMEYRVNNTGGIANPELQAFVSGGAVGAVRAGSPTEPTVLTLNTFDITADRAWTRADLLNGTFDLRCRGRNGNNASDPSYRWDYIAVEVVYTEPAGDITGTADVVLPILAADATGTVDVEGTADAVLPPLAASLSGTIDTGGGGTAAFVAAANAPTSGDSQASSRAVTKPAGAQVAVFFVCMWIGDGDTTITPSGGGGTYVLRNNTVVGNTRTATYIMYVDGDATGTTYTFTFGASKWSALKAIFWADIATGLDLVTVPFNTANVGGTGYATTTVTTVTGAGLSWGGNTAEYGTAPTSTPPTDFTETGDTNVSTAAYRISPGDGSQSASGAAATQSVNNKISSLVALAPASVGGTVSAALPALSATAAGSVDVEGTATAVLPALAVSLSGTVDTGAAGPTVRASATYASAVTETSSTVPLPSGWQVGDICYIGYELTATSGTITVPGGWAEVFTPFRSSGTTNSLLGVLRRVLQAGDTGPAISHTSGRFAAVSVAVQNADQTTPEDATPTTDDNNGVAYPDVRASSITPVTPGCLLLTFHAVRNGTNGASTSFAPDGTQAEVNEATSAVAAISNAALEVASLALTGTSPTGTKTATATSSSGTLINQMGSAIAVRPVAEAGVTGTVLAVLPALATDVSGAVDVEGTVAAVLPALSATAAGSIDVEGTATAILPALGVSLSGTVEVTGVAGAVDAILPALSASLAGELDVTGTTAALLPALTSTATGAVDVEGTATVALPALGVSATGVVGDVVAGTVNATLPALAVQAVGVLDISGSADVILPALAGVLAGELDITGISVTALPALDVSLTGVVVAAGDIAGTAVVVLPALTGGGPYVLRPPSTVVDRPFAGTVAR